MAAPNPGAVLLEVGDERQGLWVVDDNQVRTWSLDRRRHLMRYVYDVHRDPILRDFFEKLGRTRR